jgi:hypothetical protein
MEAFLAVVLWGQEWYPLGEGHAWTYEDAEGRSVVKRVTGVEKDGDADAFVVEDRGYPGDLRLQVLRPLPGELRVVRMRRGLKAPVSWLKLPLEKGRRWSADLRQAEGSDAARLDFNVAGEDDVEVPAGRFSAVRVDAAGTDDGKSTLLRLSVWLAPGTGEVKRTILVEKRGKVELDRTLVLKSFEKGQTPK